MSRMATVIVSLFILASVLAGCGRKPVPANRGVAGKNIVVVLAKESRFKSEVVAKVAVSLEGRGIRVIRDATGASGSFRAADYGAVVYFADYWAHHTPYHAKRYFNRNGGASNIVFVVTSGDPDITIKKPFDAVTSASKEKNVDRVAQEIIGRLEKILKMSEP